MKTNFREALLKVVHWKNPDAFDFYSKVFIASFSALGSLPIIIFLRKFSLSGFEQISLVSIWLLFYYKLLPKLNRDSLAIWTLIYGYIGLLLLLPGRLRVLYERGGQS